MVSTVRVTTIGYSTVWLAATATMSGPETASSSASPAPIAGPSTSPPPQYIPPKPTPPKGPLRPILKRPPPPPQPFFSFTKNILSIGSKFLPPSAAGAAPILPNGNVSHPSSANGVHGNGVVDHASPLKRAHFIVPQLSTTYLISSAAPPSTPGLDEAKRDTEDREAERRQKDSGEGTSWTVERIEDFYRECSKLRDESVLSGVTRGIQVRKVLRIDCHSQGTE